MATAAGVNMSGSISADVAIIGGGIMGASLAYWLTLLDPTVCVTVVERDPGYTTASSALSAASIRQQFTSAINIRISQASIEWLRNAHEHLAVDGDSPDIGLQERGYLHLVHEAGQPALQEAHALQHSLGADVVLLDRPQLKARFPWLDVSDLAAGALGLSGEGWFDAYTLLMSLVRKARSQGARFIRGDVTRVEATERRVASIELADGTRIACRFAINAAGPWARAVARLAGAELPVFARRRTVYVIGCKSEMPRFPLVIDPSGFWIRPEGVSFIAGFAPQQDPDDAPLEPDYEAFETELWPALAARIPAFEAARLERAWAGYYEMNVFDYNGIVGFHPQIENLAFMNGFSGHGVQQAPIVGRGMAEHILFGRFQTLDLSALAYTRLTENAPDQELQVIG